jgi:MFS family permease
MELLGAKAMNKRLQNSYKLCLRFLIDKVKDIGLIFVAVQGLSLAPSSSQWGLDPSWGWLTVQATRLGWFQNGDYVWTYGPTFFLDSQVVTWKTGYFLAVLFRFCVGFFLYYVAFNHFSKILKNKFMATFGAVLITTVSFMLFTPSLILVAAIAFYFFANLKTEFSTSWRIIALISIVTSIEILNKFFQGVLTIILCLALINARHLCLKKTVVYFTSTLFGLVSYFYLAGYGRDSLELFFRGQYELTIGYKAMASEPIGGLWEYVAFAVLSFITFWYVIKLSGFNVPAYTLLLVIFLVFQYGFVRHDSHSKTAFFFLLIISLALFGQLKAINLFFPIFLPILMFIMVSNLSIGNLLDPTPRIQGFANELRLTDPRYRSAFIQSDLVTLQQNAKLSQDMQTLIGRQTVSQIPWDQLVGRAYNLNLKSLPVPQQYSAYTPWLDETNAAFIYGKKAPKFILLSRPTAIDGRNPKWESPLSQIAVLCSYQPETYDDNWLLLKRRAKNVCLLDNPEKFRESTSQPGQNITLADVKFSESKLQKSARLLFKQFEYDKVNSNGFDWNVVHANHNYLIVNVPSEVDFPSFWSYGSQNKLVQGVNQKITYLKLKIE